MRILQVNSARRLGGGETHVLELTEMLRKLGHEVTIAGTRNGPLNPDLALPFLNSADLFTVLRLRQTLKKHPFDIVHAHVARDYTLVAAAAWGIAGPRIVFTRHLLYPVRPHLLYKRVDGWIAPTAQILTTLAPLAPKASVVIPNWVNLQKFDHRPHAIHNPIALGLLGQISPHKGHDDAIEAIRKLGEGYCLLIAGKGPTEYVDLLKKKAAGLAVQFLGFVSLPRFFEMADVLIAPSWEEPFGIVLLEAMASGIPVIATSRGGPAEIVRSGDDGLLVPARDPQAIAEAIRLLLRDGAMRERIIRNARARVQQNYDIRKVVPQVEGFYRRIVMQS